MTKAIWLDTKDGYIRQKWRQNEQTEREVWMEGLSDDVTRWFADALKRWIAEQSRRWKLYTIHKQCPQMKLPNWEWVTAREWKKPKQTKVGPERW